MSQEPMFESLDECVEHWRRHWGVPGIGVAMLHDGEVYAAGFGTQSIETGHPVTAATVFQIGSISKVYTTTLVMTLVDEGLLDLDTPVKTYLPELKLKDDNTLNVINLRHLVTHTSGVYGDFFDDFGMGDDALARYVEAMAELRQVYAPDELWAYTNSGFNLAGLVIERLLDMPFEDAMRERMIDKAGWERTFQFPFEAITYPLAVGHTHPDPFDDDRMEVARRYPLPRTSHAAGGIIATPADLVEFARLHLNAGRAGDVQVVSEASVNAMQVPQVKAANFTDWWGLGWMIWDLDGARAIGHSGTTNGFQAAFRIVPEHDFALAILTNGDGGHAAEGPIIEWAFEHYLGVKTPKPATIEIGEDQFARVAGRYTQPHAELVVRGDADGYWLDLFSKSALDPDAEPKALPPVRIEPVGELEFQVTSGLRIGTTLDFIENPDGTVRFIRFGGRLADRVEQ